MNLNGTVFECDTVCHYYIGPGVTHTQLTMSNAEGRRVDVFVATLDKDDPTYQPHVSPRVEIAADHPHQTEEISKTATRKSGGDRQYIAGINADFFQMVDHNLNYWGWPVNGTVIDGKIASESAYDSKLQAIAIGPDGMWIDNTGCFTYTISSADGAHSVNANHVNTANRNGNELYIYNDYMEGRVTTSADWDKDLVLRLAEDSQWAVNTPVKFVVAEDWKNGASAIPENGMVLTATKDYENEWLYSLKTGDEISLLIDKPLEKNGNIRPEITHFVSGDVHVLNGGKTEFSPEQWWYGSNDHIYPISLAGYSADQRKIVYATVARKPSVNSMGVTYPESADLMRYLGCDEALNFDGGGSATMYAAPMGVVSFILYEVERPVGNGMYFAMDTPVDNEVASIRFRDYAKELNFHGFFKPCILGYNKYGQLVDTDVTGYEIAPSDYYEVRDGGIVADKPGCYALSVSKNGMTASIAVNVSDSELSSPCSVIVIDSKHTAMPRVQSMLNGTLTDIPAGVFSWKSENPSVAEIDAETGLITAVSNGTTTVCGTRGEDKIEIPVSVENAAAPVVTLDKDFGDISWGATLDGLENLTVTPAGEGWIMTFNSTRLRGLCMTVAKDVRVYGLPVSAVFDVNTNGGKFSTVRMSFSDAEGKDYTIDAEDGYNDGGKITFDVAAALGSTESYLYPLTFKSMEICPLKNDDGSKDYRYDIAAFGFAYDYVETSVDNVAASQHYSTLPLTVSGNTVSTVPEATSLEIYAADGTLVSRSAGNTAESPAKHGIYIVRATMPGTVMSAKIRL